MVNISLIIVHYKVKDKLFECLRSIYGLNTKISFEIIVVDNDEEKKIDKELNKKFPKVKCIKSDGNIGFGAGNNLGAKHAKGRYLFFLNPDTRVLDKSIKVLYEFLENHKNAGIVSPLILGNDNQPLDRQGYKELNLINGFFTFSFLRKKFRWLSVSSFYSLDDWEKKPVKKVDTVYGAALMMPTALFKKIGGFDESFFLFFEENDLSKRVRKLGYDLYINSNARIVHEVGQSTKQIKGTEKYFDHSRFLYFKKHFGFFQAIFLEFLLKINKTFLFLIFILSIALFLRLYNLSTGMQFIGDQGWFYLSARDLIINGKIPLIGITSSHTWLHQGPLWTYILSVGLLITKFNPLSGGYITALFGLITTYLMYRLGSEMFSKKTGYIAAMLYAVSPLITISDRIPFDPSPIPFFTLLYLYSLYKWLNGEVKYFPAIPVLIAILYNLELSTFILFFIFILVLLYGVIKKKYWVLNAINKKNIILSASLTILIMFPVIIYDFHNEFAQTIVFLGWTLYKPFSFLISNHPISSNFPETINFMALNMQKLIFGPSFLISIIMFILSIIAILYTSVQKKRVKIESAHFLLIFLFTVSIIGILVNKTPSDAYIPIIFPFITYIIALGLTYLININSLKYVGIFTLILLFLGNFYFSFNTISSSNEFKNRMIAVNKILSLTNGVNYNLIGKGEGSQFDSFTMNYQYLLWWKGHPESSTMQKVKIIIYEHNGIIDVSKIVR